SAFGFIRNAYDPTRNPSGSSGGTGSSVAANFGLVGIGEDTGGSVRGPAAVSNLFGLRPTLQLVSRHGMLPANPTQDTMGPMTRTATDAALLLNVMAGYDAADPITSYAVGRVPASYAAGLTPDALRGARIGVLRTPSDTGTDQASDDYRKVRAVIDRAIADLRAQGATVVDSVLIPELAVASRLSNDFETEEATNAYLKEHPNAPVRTLKEIVLSGKVVPWRAKGLISLVGKTMDDPGYLQVMRKREALRVAVLKLMADERLDAIIYATFDHQPTVIAEDIETNASPKDGYGRGDNRGLSPMIAFPALAIPAGFTTDSLPVGIDMLGRPFSEAMLLRYGYAFEQATDRRRPPSATPSLTPRPRGPKNK
ncbi:MAG: amidase family protein, partial [Gemmatimonadaceae bacterium]